MSTPSPNANRPLPNANRPLPKPTPSATGERKAPGGKSDAEKELEKLRAETARLNREKTELESLAKVFSFSFSFFLC